MNTLVFDIETVPDVAFGRRLYDLGALPDEQVAKAMFALRRQGRGGDFLPLEQHRVVAISCALRKGDAFTLWSVGEAASGEGELVQRFFDGIAKFTPDLVSWNGSGFDLPVLQLPRAPAGACRRRVSGRRARAKPSSATTTICSAITGGIPISWTYCRASAPATGRRSPTWRAC